MGNNKYRSLSGPRGTKYKCPVDDCQVSRDRVSDVQDHVRRLHAFEHLSQAQLNSIHAQYCEYCHVLCSTYNDGAKHRSQCPANPHRQPSRDRDAPRRGRSRGISRSRSSGRDRSAVSMPPVVATTSTGLGAPPVEPVPDRSMLTRHVTEQGPHQTTDTPADDLQQFMLMLADDGVEGILPQHSSTPAPHPPPTSDVIDVVAALAEHPAGDHAQEATASHIAAIVPAVEGLDIAGVDHIMHAAEPTPPAPAAPTPPRPLPAAPSHVSPIAPEVKPAPFVPYQSRFRHGEVTGHLLQLCKDAANRGGGQGFSQAVDLLLQMPGLVLTGGAGRSRGRKVNKRLELLMAGRMVELLLLEDDASPQGERRRRQRRHPDQAALQRQQAQRARRQLELGSVQRSARTLSATGLVEVTDGVLQQLQEKHPVAEPPMLPPSPETAPPPVSVSADVFRDVLQKLPRGSAAGPSGWTYEMIRSAVLHDDSAFEGALWLVNAQLAGTLPHCENLLASRLIPISKHTAEELLMLPADAVPDVRPIAIGEVWNRLAALCALATLPNVGPSLQPHQLGVGVRGGAQIVGHAVRAGCNSADMVTVQVDICNAFNSVSRNVVLEQVFDRVPALGPWAAFAYGTPSKLYVDGAPAGSAPLLSCDGVRQGDPTGPLLFALAIQPILERTAAAHPDCSVVAYADDITLQGPQQAVESVFRSLRDELTPLRLRVNPTKCKVYCVDAAAATETAANIGCSAETLLVVAGTPIGQPERVSQYVTSRVVSTEACVDKLLGLPLSPQEQYLMLHGSLQHREDHLLRVVDWGILQEPMQRLETKVVAAVKAIAELSDEELQAPQRALLHLPHRLAGFAIQHFEEDVSDAAFLAAAALASNAMARGPEQFRPFSNAGAVDLRARWERLRQEYPEVCPPAMPPDVLVEQFLPEVQRTITRARAQRGFDHLLEDYSAALVEGQHQQLSEALRNCARLRSNACRPASVWLTTLPTSPSLRLQPEEFLTSFRLRLGVSVLHQDTDSVQCFCHRRVPNAHSDHSLVCQSVKRMITSRHNMLVSSWRRIMGRAGVASTREPTVAEHLHSDAERRPHSAVYGDILAMLPHRLTVTDVSVIHPGADTYVRAASSSAGSAARTRDAQKFAHYSRAGSAVYRMVPLSHESYGRLGQPASKLLNELANLASSTGAVEKPRFVESALQELSISLCRGNHRVVTAYAALNARMTGSALIPGLPVPTTDASAMDGM